MVHVRQFSTALARPWRVSLLLTLLHAKMQQMKRSPVWWNLLWRALVVIAAPHFFLRSSVFRMNDRSFVGQCDICLARGWDCVSWLGKECCAGLIYQEDHGWICLWEHPAIVPAGREYWWDRVKGRFILNGELDIFRGWIKNNVDFFSNGFLTSWMDG